MSTIQKNINIIHNCEERFYNWLRVRLSSQGISPDHQKDLSELLEHYSSELSSFRQHLKPLLKWNKIKDECYEMNSALNGHAEQDEDLRELIEKTAFDGQILWLTFQEE